MQLSREIHPRVRWLMKKPIAVLWSIKNGYRNTLTLGQQKMGKSFIGSLRQTNSACTCVVCSACSSPQSMQGSRFLSGSSYISCHCRGLTLVSCLSFQLHLRADTSTPEHVLSLKPYETGVFPCPEHSLPVTKSLEALGEEFWQRLHIPPTFSEAGQVLGDVSGMPISAGGEPGRAPAVKVDSSQWIQQD